MAVGDVYRLTLGATYITSPIQNVFNYRMLGSGVGATPANVLVDEFVTQVLPAIADVVHEATNFNSIACQNWNSFIDYYSAPYNVDGTRTGSTMPAFVSWYFRMNRTSGPLKAGRKYFGGVSEADTSNNSPVGGIIDLLDDLAVLLATDLSDGTGYIFSPCIARYPAEANMPYIPASTLVSGALFIGVSTQNGRKRFTG